MDKVISLANIAVGVALWVVAICVELSWLTICFGTVVIGFLLLIFAPFVLITPIAFIAAFANLFLFKGIDGLYGKNGALLRGRLVPPN